MNVLKAGFARGNITPMRGIPMEGYFSPRFAQGVLDDLELNVLALEAGEGASAVASLWGIKSYPADKLVASAKRFSLRWCRRAVIRCGETDLAMKSTGQDGQQLLTALLLELSMPA